MTTPNDSPIMSRDDEIERVKDELIVSLRDGNDIITKLKAEIEQLNAENKKLRENHREVQARVIEYAASRVSLRAADAKPYPRGALRKAATELLEIAADILEGKVRS